MATHKALVLREFGKEVVYEEFPKPVPAPGQFLIKVDASTVNPSDRYRLTGHYQPVPLPSAFGLEGTGRVVEANGEDIQDWIGKRVSFISGSGAWGQFALSDPIRSFPIDEDVPLHSAASGIVNPLTVIGMTELYKAHPQKRGLIHTAAASALGRQLNSYAKTLGIPLLNIVRRKEHKDLLVSEGAEHVIVTEGDWVEEYKEAIKSHGFNVLFDALGGGPVTEALITNLEKDSIAYIYGSL
ncbi:unnamed protein product [Sphagnum balticum]